MKSKKIMTLSVSLVVVIALLLIILFSINSGDKYVLENREAVILALEDTGMPSDEIDALSDIEKGFIYEKIGNLDARFSKAEVSSAEGVTVGVISFKQGDVYHIFPFFELARKSSFDNAVFRADMYPNYISVAPCDMLLFKNSVDLSENVLETGTSLCGLEYSFSGAGSKGYGGLGYLSVLKTEVSATGAVSVNYSGADNYGDNFNIE